MSLTDRIGGLRYLYGRKRILGMIPRDAVTAEIGVWKGRLSGDILRRKPKALHLIDPWAFAPAFPQRYYGGAIARSQGDMDAIYEDVRARFGKNPAVQIHRLTSVEAASQFPDCHFDWIYIDGDHSAAAVLDDLAAWHPKIKPQGVIALDDYDWRDESLQYSIRAALEKFLAKTKVASARPIAGQFVIRV